MPKGVYGEKQPWTDENTEQLKALWQDGLSAGQCAKRLGRGFTRNAVIGKIFRLGLSGTHPKAPPKPRAHRRCPSAPTRARAPKRTASSVATPPSLLPEPEPLFAIDVPQGDRCTLKMLNSHTCRWPMGDPSSPDFYFCGREPELGHSYCAYHCCIAYQTVTKRRAERKARTFLEAAE